MADKRRVDEPTEGEAPAEVVIVEAVTVRDLDAYLAEAPADAPRPKRYRVLFAELGSWRQGDLITAEDVGGELRVRKLQRRGAVVLV